MVRFSVGRSIGRTHGQIFTLLASVDRHRKSAGTYNLSDISSEIGVWGVQKKCVGGGLAFVAGLEVKKVLLTSAASIPMLVAPTFIADSISLSPMISCVLMLDRVVRSAFILISLAFSTGQQ